MIIKLFAVVIGGSIGAGLRFLIYELFEPKYHSNFPWATFTVNLLGSLVVGFLVGYFALTYVSPGLHLLIFVGIPGSFTIFSTFAFDNFSLLKSGEFSYMTIHFPATNIFGILLATGGYLLPKSIKSSAFPLPCHA